MIENLVRQDDIKVKVANFCAAMDTIIDQDDFLRKSVDIMASSWNY